VVLRVILRGTHLSEFPPGVGPALIMGAMPPTGRSFEADQIHIHRVAGGKVVEHAASRNDLLMLSQLGLLPGIKPVNEAAWHHGTWITRRLDIRPLPKSEHHDARHEPTLIATARSQMTASSPARHIQSG
jgi:hypothetical protein